MPCFCGNKVDRFEPSKVLCIVCSELMHAKCVKAKYKDASYLKDKFKCEKCTRTRRSSHSTAPVFVGGASSSSNAVVTDTNKNSVVVVSSDKTITLDMVYAELVSLRQTNNCYLHTINTLTNKVDELKAAIDEMSIVYNAHKMVDVVVDNAVKLSSGLDEADNNNNNSSTIADGALSIVTFADVVSNNSGAVSKVAKSTGTCSQINNNNNKQHMSNSNNNTNNNNTGNDTGLSCESMQNVVTIPPNVNYKNKNKKRSVLIGTNDNNDLGVIAKKKFVHLSFFKTDVMPADIIAYVVKYTNIKHNHLECFKLVSKDADLSKLKFVNFKLGVSACFYDKIFKASLWPANITVRPFHFLEKKEKLQLPPELTTL